MWKQTPTSEAPAEPQSGPGDLPEPRSMLHEKHIKPASLSPVRLSTQATAVYHGESHHSPGWGRTAACLQVPGTVRAGSSPVPRGQGALLAALMGTCNGP